MEGNNQIVRDVVSLQQAKTVTPDYQSPNGPANIISGFTDGLLKGLSKAGSGSGSDKSYNEDVYKLFKEEADYLASANVSDAELKKRNKDVIQKALKISKGDWSGIQSAMDAAGYKDYQGVLESFYKRDAASKQAQYELVEAAGVASVGIDAPSYMKEIAGYNYLNSDTVQRGLYNALKMTSPKQQADMIDNENTIGLSESYVGIKQGWRKYLADNAGKNPGVLFDQYVNATVSAISNEGVDLPVAQKIVNRALVMESASLFGEEGSVKASYAQGLMDLAQGYQSKENQLVEDMRMADFLKKPLTISYRTPGVNGRQQATMSGADWVARYKSMPELFKTLADIQMPELIPQILSSEDQTFNNKALNWMLTDSAVNVMNEGGSAGNQDVVNNISSGAKQTLDAVIREKSNSNASNLKGKGYADIRKFNSYLEKAGVDALGLIEEDMKVAQKDDLFKSIALGTNIETDNEGFWQIDSSGKLHYLRYGGKDWSGNPLLVDATNSEGFLGFGSYSAPNQKRYAADIEKNLKLLEKKYGFSKESMYEDFNRAQVRDTRGAQAFRMNQLNKPFVYRENLTKDMSEEDIDAVMQQAQKVGLDIPGVFGYALSGIGEGVADAASLIGDVTEMAASAPTAGVLEAGKELGEFTAYATSDQRAREIQREADRAEVKRVIRESAPAKRAPREEKAFGAENIKRNNPLGITKNPNRTPVGASSKQDSSRFVTYNTIEDAYRDGSKILDAYFKMGKDTIAEIINRWAPPQENPTDSYISYVADEMNTAPDQVLKNTPEIKAELMRAMTKFETGVVPLLYEDILRAIQ